MTMHEAAAAVSLVPELRRFQASAYRSDVVGVEWGLQAGQPLFYEYFDSTGRLFCVACDAVRGPWITLGGVELNGRTRAEVDQWLATVSESLRIGVAYGPAGNPGIEE